MKVSYLTKIIYCATLVFFTLLGFTQKSQKFNVDNKITDTINTISSYSQSTLFDFPNINKIYYYNKPAMMEKIIKLNIEKNWKDLYPILKKYIRQFGIKNFHEDTYWLWKLAKITEIYGNASEAKLLYKLVLKHHRNDIDIQKIEPHFNELTKNDRDYYVPLEYYYKLAEHRKEIDTLRPPRKVLQNMGVNINSDFSDYGPTLSNDNNEIIFTSKRNTHYRGVDPIMDEDIFHAFLKNNRWTKSKEFDGINTSYNEGSATISKDRSMIVFSRCGSPEGYGSCDIFTSQRDENGKWKRAKNLGKNINSIYWDSHPSLSHSEDTLYFASDRLGGFGLSDIYYSVKNKNGKWSKALNLGPIINTRNSEVSPFYHHIYDVLYFSSNGQNIDFGEFDIFKSYYDGKNWKEPINVGPLVNGVGSEYYFTIDSKSENLYFAKSKIKKDDNFNLFSFPLPMGAHPDADTKFRGSLTDELSQSPLKGIVSIIDLDEGVEVAPKYLRPDGSFTFDLINKRNYLLVIQGDEFLKIEELFYLDGEMQLDLTTNSIYSKLKFESINFERGKAELSTAMFNDLNKLSTFLLDNQDFKLIISGHTDSMGEEKYNLKLSQERADLIKEYLVFFGDISEERIIAKGYGSSMPIKGKNTDNPLNRRVEFELFKDVLSEETTK